MKRLVSTILIAVSIFSSGYADWMTSVSSTISLDLDLSSGVRDTYGEESLTFSSLWSEDASAVVRLASNGVSLMADQNGEGVLKWNEKTPGLYMLTHTTIKSGDATEVLTAQFAVILRTFDENVIVGFEGVYDGASHSTQSSIPEGARIVYSTVENGVYTEVKPTFITAGTYTVWYKITKSGYYEKAGSVDVKITPKTLVSSMVSLSGASGLVYDGTQKRPEVVVSDDGRITSYDYSVTYSNNVNPGMATVTIVGKRNYTGTVTKTFAIYQNVAVGGIHWAGEGDAGWTIESENPFSATSGAIGNSQKTSLIAAVSGLGKVSFKWKVSSEASHDKLTLIVDGVEEKNISGTLGTWEDVQIYLGTDGDHEIKWVYSKDIGRAEGDDRAWVKDVVFDSSYLVVFDANGGEGVPLTQKMQYGQVGELTKNHYRCLGYSFVGWSLTSGGEISHDDGAIVLNLASVAEGIVTLYAKWRPNNYDILFDSNSGEGAMSHVSATYDETLSLPENTFKKAGYSFVGWSVTPNGAVKYFDKQHVQNLSVDDRGLVTLYAVWAKNLYESVLSGFISKYLTSSSLVFDTTTDIWDASAAYVEEADTLYASSLASYTTVAYGTHMYMEKGVTYNFRGKYADYAAVKVDGSWVVPKSSSSGSAVSGSYTASSTGWRKVEFRVGNYTGSGGVLSSSYYGIQWKRSSESTWRNIEATGNWPLFTVAPPFVVKNSLTDTASTATINGTAYIQYGKYEGEREVSLWIDGTEVLCSEEAGVFVWQPSEIGEYEITWKSGLHATSLTVNVVSVVGAESAPNPPTEVDENISLKITEATATANGGAKMIGVLASTAWSATTDADWITLRTASGTGNGNVVCSIAASTYASERVGYVYVSGHVCTVRQAGVGATLDQDSAEFDAAGGDGNVTIVVDTDITWQARSNVDWISLSQTSGTGETEITYTVAPWNEVTTRTGTITAGGQTFTVTQTGCPLKLSTSEVELDYNSHALDIQVNAFSDTTWEIFLGNSWISIVDGGSGKGGDNVLLAINENPSYVSRTGRVTIGTEEIIIHQEGRANSVLSFAITPTESDASVKGANGMIAVLATPDLPWTVQSTASWLTIMPGFESGAGNGNVIYTVSPNPNMAERTGAITVMPVAASGLATKTHTIQQAAATALISNDAHTFAAAGDSVQVDVIVDDGVIWSIVENSDWVSVERSAELGPASVTITASPNMSIDARTCEITIASHVFTVSQKGRTVEVESTSQVHGTTWEGDFATIDVHPDGDIDWEATVSDSWIYIIAYENCSDDGTGSYVYGTGDGTIGYILEDYVGDGEPRTGWIDIGDKRVYVTQRAYELSIDPIGETVTGNAGEGRISVSATID